MPPFIKTLGKLVRRLYLITLDWLYVTYWQIHDFIKRDDPHLYEHPAQPRPPIIVMLPGVYEPWSFMRPLSAFLFQHGYRIYVIEGLGYNTGVIADMAAIAQQYIATLPDTDIVLVAHSKGGLIGKYLMAHHNADGRVRQMIAINSPFAGSVYANFAPIRNLKIFSPRDATLRQLQANQAINRQITSIYSVDDPNIPGGSHLDGARNIPVDTVGHFRIIAHPMVHDHITETLEMGYHKNMSPIDDYLAALPADQRAVLQRIRDLVHQLAPTAEESIAYKMPAFKYQKKPLLYFAAFKDHLSLFPTPGPAAAVADRLASYTTGKGTIQFSVDKPLPDDLVADIITTRLAEIDGSK